MSSPPALRLLQALEKALRGSASPAAKSPPKKEDPVIATLAQTIKAVAATQQELHAVSNIIQIIQLQLQKVQKEKGPQGDSIIGPEGRSPIHVSNVEPDPSISKTGDIWVQI